jgi:RND family efflux transporter MFP subunit
MIARTFQSRLPVAACLALFVTGSAQAQSLAESTFDCLIEPAQVVKLGTPVEGILADVLVDRGDAVKVGQVVAHMESGVEQAMYALAQARGEDESAIRSAEARHAFLLRKVERLKGLLAKAIVSKAEVEEAQAETEVALQDINQAKANLTVARLDADRAQAVLRLRTILSPVDGVVTEVQMAPGEYRNGQQQIATIARTDHLRVEVFVSNAYFGRIRKGTTARIVPDEPVGGQYDGTVTVVDEVLDAKSGTFGVRLDLPNPERKVPAGLSCRIQFPGPG